MRVQQLRIEPFHALRPHPEEPERSEGVSKDGHTSESVAMVRDGTLRVPPHHEAEHAIGTESQPAEIAKLLHALALHLGAVDIALAVDADEVEVVELAELVADAPDAVHHLAADAVDHVELAVRVVHDQEISLRCIGPLD